MKDTLSRWLGKVLKRTGWDAAELARRSGVSASTISRALDADAKHILNTANVMRIAEASGVPWPGAPRAGFAAAGLTEAEADPYDHTPDAPPESAKHDHWTLCSAAVSLLGYLPGDIVAVDRSTTARAGDVVQAQIYSASGAETVFRAFDPPYLVTRSADAAAYRKPELVDGARVLVVGVVVAAWRFRRD